MIVDRPVRARDRREITADLVQLLVRVRGMEAVDAMNLDAFRSNDELFDDALDDLMAAAVHGSDSTIMIAILILESEWRQSRARSSTRRRDELAASLDRLRECQTAADLVEMVCAEAVQACGVDRALFAFVQGEFWMAQSSVCNSQSLESGVKRYSDSRIPLVDLPVESEFATKFLTTFVDTPGHKSGAPAAVRNLMRADPFAIVPILGTENIMGALYLPCTATSFDSSMVNFLGCAETFARSAGHTLGRLLMAQRLKSQRFRVREAQTAAERIIARFDTSIDLVQLVGREYIAPSGAGSESPPPRKSAFYASITPRELEVMALVAEGVGDAQIAEELAIAPSTVKTHVRNVMRKSRAVNRADLIMRYHCFPDVGG